MTLLLARSSLRLTRHEKIFPLAKTQSFRVLLTPLTYIHVGQDRKGFSWRSLRLCELMLKIAQEFPEYKPGADKIGLVDVSSGAYCGAGYQDIQTRVPWIEITKADLEWRPAVSLQDALRNIFAAYRVKWEQPEPCWMTKDALSLLKLFYTACLLPLLLYCVTGMAGEVALTAEKPVYPTCSKT